MRFDVHELPERRVQREAVHPVTLEGYDELCGGSIHAIPSHKEVAAFAQDVIQGGWFLSAALLFVDAENGPSADVAVDVAAAVERVERNNEAPRLRRGHKDGLLILLGDQHGARAAVHQGVDEDVVGQHVQLLLVVACGVHLAREAEQVSDARLAARARRGLAGEGQRHQQQGHLVVPSAGHDVPLQGGELRDAHAVRRPGDHEVWFLRGGLRHVFWLCHGRACRFLQVRGRCAAPSGGTGGVLDEK
mmetsp:Transcript_102548/g.290483  ORF Transcript_102548/g.290483 Transcript_102548/m.290483 type:complete len:247 (+) Transcript_102548:685-1425(+)